ncbi:GNAT family N-acetyltransferase (plasmid) [Haloferax mediterranei ATCC 33500]|uniref:Acetyltransferase n=1 Tax=Haloferax mediterranei (strain ATCC 33500 / DSM 1411 / JCM 8866 / NBRC 14739 / NCIMB 2177 / R-4) TaxID=523841 RepID=I3RAB6_HALMT|nr:GNAT family N-acetyltransferase [Haloferax mediterranei]AFK21176.1 GCN5-related N-acetyltransferase [Haloferax mediterranei ATCC 33500]AHZ24706.1 acetyltransferase [Haloferax mediterranei ATCC 33500]ELZ97489.1 N-acetyltransferase GCN5 [Haloferax mediterranei ATCC 33500]MDX5990219.1 GNAT family N-acetyltransferase [Haloferax mediterranei ATCC 33500]QCQ76711.1 GNAT family N-acetyltransferase [Haloferax mediterranei ATCC 33500]
MQATERPTFESEASKRIYEYVERHGTAKRNVLLDIAPVSSDEFQVELDRLKSRGYLEEDGGTLQLALKVGAIEEYESDVGVVTIRPARQQDFQGLVDTIRDVTAEETYVVAESIAEQLLYEETVTRHNQIKSRVFFIAAIDDEVVGWTHLDLPQLAKVQETAQQTVGVKEEYHGHGIGSQLLQRGLDWAEANGYRKVYNSIPMTNDRAMEFLGAHGWETEAIRRDHYTIDGEYVDEVMMAYRF